MRKHAILGIALGILVAIAIVYATPPQDDFHIENPHWNGLSDFASIFNATPLWSASELAAYEPSKCALFIIGPSLGFSQSYVDSIKGFLRRGGLLVIADDFGSANELLEALGLEVRISGILLLDPLMNEKSREMPKAFRAENLSNAAFQKVSLNLASSIDVKGPCTVLLTSSSFSFLDFNENRECDDGEPKGPFVIACTVNFEENGRVVVISDPSLFINSMIHRSDNVEFVRTIIGGRNVLLDCFHWKLSMSTVLRMRVNDALGALSHYEVRYLIPLIAALALWRLKLLSGKPKAKSS